MRYLCLDESGNLSTTFQYAGTSKYFVVTILEVDSMNANKAIEKAVRLTLKNKIYRKRAPKRKQMLELKGFQTALSVKQYFYRQVSSIPFNIYTVILNKKKYVDELKENKSRVYNFTTHLVLKKMPLEQAQTKITLTVDRSKSKPEIREFDTYLFNQLESRIPPSVPFDIYHDYSHENKGLQAVDLFAWGIFRKYEFGNTEWYDLFKERIVSEDLYAK